MSQRIQILYHGFCFDGVVSAAILTRFLLERSPSGSTVGYRGMAHGPKDPFGPDHDAALSADVNAVVDFRYSPSARLHWWCDHHQTTFLDPVHRQHFEEDRTGRKCFDPSAPSCAGLLRRWLVERHGLEDGIFEDHARWADIIDGARFTDAAQAVELREPALQLMMLLESAPPVELCEILISTLSRESLEAAWRAPPTQHALAPVLDQHRRTIDLFRTRTVLDGGVASFDLTADGVEGFNKFIPYYLAPEARYTVGLTASARRTKVSVGSNPWRRPEPLVNLGDLCGRYGGGGHAVVGAVTLPPSDLEGARRVFLEITRILRGEG